MKNSYIFKVGAAVLISMIAQGTVFAGGSKVKKVSPESADQNFEWAIKRKVETHIAMQEKAGIDAVGLLITFQKSNAKGFAALLKAYNEVKKRTDDSTSVSTIISMLTNLLPPEVLEWLKTNNLLDENGQISQIVWDTLNLTQGIVTDGISAAKEKACGIWCKSCWKQNAPAFISLTAELILPILANIAIGQLTKGGKLSEDQAVRTFFDTLATPPSPTEEQTDRFMIEDKHVLKFLKKLREDVAAIILNSDAHLLSWTNIIKNLEDQIKEAIKAGNTK